MTSRKYTAQPSGNSIWIAVGLVPMESLWGNKVGEREPVLLPSSVLEDSSEERGGTGEAYQIMSFGCGA